MNTALLKTFARPLILAAMIATGSGTAMAAEAPRSCDALAKIALPHGEITAATLVEKGGFTLPPGAMGPPGGSPAFKVTPAFCRVQATLRPSADSDIHVEVWMPAQGWNGRFEEVGNNAYSAGISYDRLATGVIKGYAVAVSDTGHDDAHEKDFAIGHPEKLIDWGYRAVHETTVTAKSLIKDFYGKPAAYSYWNSCSTGGRQGWVEAEYYPGDFDGMAIGDPANPMTRLQANSIWNTLALTKTPESFIQPATWAAIHQTVMAQCDARDGAKDGYIENPMACGITPAMLACKEAQTTACLTAPQVVALEAIVQGSKNPRTGEQLYPGYPIATRMGPGPLAGKEPDTAAPETFRLLFQKADWDYHTFDFDKDTARADAMGAHLMNAADPARLKPLFAHGGKILMYHGWEDPAITPLEGIKLYEDAVAANGGKAKTTNAIRLFLIPGAGHCETPFDVLETIADWVEHGKTPETIIATRKAPGASRDAKPVGTHPLCAYPKVAIYDGKGDVNEAASFACGIAIAAPGKGGERG